MKFTKFEKIIGLILGYFPFLKKLVKISYLNINYLIFKSKNKNILENNGYEVKLKSYFENGKDIFVGYYDINPMNVSGNLIYHKTRRTGSDFRKNETIDIMIDNERISETNTWNYQIGSRLMWADEENIIHNFYLKSYKSVLINIKNGQKIIFDFPVYACSKKYLITNDFNRLAILTDEYGYYNEYSKCDLSKKSEIHIFDLEKNCLKFLFSLEDISYFVEGRKNNYAYINHIQFLTDSEKGFYFHYRRKDEKSKKILSSLIMFDLKKSEFRLLADSGIVSHLNNYDENSIVGWLKYNNKIGYYKIDINNLEYKEIGKCILDEDGHPTVKYGLMLTDTYPDRSGMQHLIVYDTLENRKLYEFQFFSPIRYRLEKRCDLHPRFVDIKKNNEIKFVIDSVHEGNRGVYIGEVFKCNNGCL